MGDVTLTDNMRPIEQQTQALLQAVQAVTQGDLEAALEFPAGDGALAELGEAVRRMVGCLRDSIREQSEARAVAERGRQELEAALAQAQTEQQRQFRRQWSDYTEGEAGLGYMRAGGREGHTSEGWLPAMAQAVVRNHTVSAADPQEGLTLAAPLQLYGEVLGAVGFCREESRPWSGDEIGTVETVLEQVALALESQRLFDEEQRARSLLGARVKELDCLNDVGRKIDEVPPVPEFLEWMAGRIPAAMQYPEMCQVAIELEGRVFGSPSAPQFASHMVQGLMVGGERLGRLVVAYSQDRPFLDEESSLLGDIARRAAGYVENRRLLEQIQVSLAESEMLLAVAQGLARLTDVDEMYSFVLLQYLRVLGLSQGGLLIHDEDGAWGTLRALVRDGKLVEPGLRIPVAGNPAMERLVASQEPVVIDDARHSDLVAPVQELAAELGYRSLLLVPIIARGKVIGTLGADAVDDVHHFTPREVTLVQTVANQLSIALENRRLLQETQVALSNTQALYRSAQMVTSFESLPDTLQAIADGVAEALPADRVALYTLDVERQRVTNFVKAGRQAAEIGPVDYPELTVGLTGWVLREMKPALSLKGVPDPRESPEVQHRRTSLGSGSIVVVPVVYRSQALGTITAINGVDGADFTPRDVDLMAAMANQAAAAMENTRLLEETRHRAEELALLNRVSLELAQEQQDLQTLLQTVSQRIMELLDSDGGGVWLWQELDQELELVVSFQASGADLTARRLKPGEGLTGRAFAQQAVMAVDDYLTWSGRSPVFDDAPFVAALAVPMTWQRQTIGVLAATRSQTGRPFSAQEQDLAQLAAAQAAAVIQNARLLEEARRRAEEQAVLGRVGQALAACQDEESVLHGVYEGASQVLEARDFYITLYDEQSGDSVFALRATNGQVKPPGARRRVGRGGLTDHILRTRRPLLLSDRIGETIQDLGLTALPLRAPSPAHTTAKGERATPKAAHSWLGVPIVLGERVLGTMVALSYTVPRAYDRRSEELLMTLANQAALALQNVRSLAETRAALDEVETTHRSYVRRGWQEHLRQHQLLEDSGFLFDASVALQPGALGQAGAPGPDEPAVSAAAAPEVAVVPRLWRPEMEQALVAGVPSRSEKEQGARSGLAVPITLRGQTLGVLGVEAPGGERQWTEEDLTLVQTVSEQLAQTLETARLFADTQRGAERERLIGEISARVRASTDIRTILETTAVELGRALGTSRTLVRLGVEPSTADPAQGGQATGEEEPCLD